MSIRVDRLESVWDNPRVIRLLTRVIPALIVAAWLAPSFATIAVGFHLWIDHHGELHSHPADALETKLSEEDEHEHQLLIEADEEVRLTRGQATSGPASRLASAVPTPVPEPGAARASAFLDGASRHGPAAHRYLSHCAFLL